MFLLLAAGFVSLLLWPTPLTAAVFLVAMGGYAIAAQVSRWLEAERERTVE